MNPITYNNKCRPTLYLGDSSSIRNGTSQEGLLNTFYSENQMVIANFAKESLETQNVDGQTTRSLWGKCINPLSQEIIDPKNKLQKLFDQKKIEEVKANAPIDQAEIILLDDTFHGNQEQAMIR